MYRVIEIGHVIAAPYAGEILTHLGFEVIKVEPLQGDPTRSDDVLEDTMFIFNNRGKKSIALDLKKEKGKEILARLIKNSHVLIENLSPNSMERLGFTDEFLFGINPSLVYCSIKGYPKGEYENLPAFGTIIEAISGIMEANDKARLPASITDMSSSTYCVITILWALLMGRPGHYRVNIVQSDLAWLGYYLIAYQKMRKTFEGGKDELPFWAPYELFSSLEGREFYLAINDNNKWSRLCKILGLEELLNDERFKTNADRVKNRKVLHEILQDRFCKMKFNEIISLLRSNDIPVSEMNRIQDLVGAKFAEWERIDDNILVPKLPLIGSLEGKKAPKLGENTREILLNLGYSEDDIKKFAEEKVIKLSNYYV
ncbi:CaiB/BaiF CoA transferase family protein [Saccharolobus caldissimus]|uniref:CoA transferase n=1 Tax=Saccharolobus caldissimus TaxID=1702097 RepID=A0AAQ4CR07_9CREN|nr:CaiB/BaiF CoA-transferase family protein [Saccharolobus caldissimus]BDB98238.1 CoA transferase [Saccharolobus caldissimus]